MTSVRHDRLLLMVPQPPPVGGLATLGKMLHQQYATRAGFFFLDTARGDSGADIFLAFRRLVTMVRLIRRHHIGHLFAFASAGRSFWEKCAWMLVGRVFRARMTVMMVDGNFPRFYSSLPAPLSWTVRKLIGTFETVVAQSPSWEAFYLSLAPTAQIVVVRAGVDATIFRPAEASGGGPPRMLFVGWWMTAKGVQELLTAALMLRDHGIEYDLRVVGPDKGAGEWMQSFVARNGLDRHVKLLGCLPDVSDMVREYRTSDIFVLPTHYEGFPNALIEAMACALAPVAAAVGGIPDILEDEVSGLLVPAREPPALCRALERVLTDEQLRRALGRSARQRVLSDFTIEASMRDYKRLYAGLLNDRSPGPVRL